MAKESTAGVEVDYVSLHNDLHVPNLDGGATLNKVLTKGPKYADIKLVVNKDGVLATIKGTEIFIPMTMVTHIVAKLPGKKS